MKTLASIIGLVLAVLAVIWLAGWMARSGYSIWTNAWGTSAPVCEQVNGACTAREQLLVLQTEVKSGEKIGISKLMLEAQSAASVIIAVEKARLAEENFNRRARELQARVEQLEASKSSNPAPTHDPCAGLRGRTKEVCAGL